MANTQVKRVTLSGLVACGVVSLCAGLALAQPAAAPPPPPPQPDVTAGWTPLGQFELRGRGGRDVLPVGVQEGSYRRLLLKLLPPKNPKQLIVLDVAQLKITFGNNEVMTVDWLKQLSGAQQPFAEIDLPGDVRHIKTIEMRHKGRGRIKVAVFAREAAPPPPAPVPVPVPPVTGPARPGWEYLGTARVADGKLGPDVIRVGRKDGRFNKLMIAVDGADLVLADVLVRFGNGETVSPAQGHEYTFQQNVHSTELALPNELRFVAAVSFRYARIAGGGKAQIHLYGMSEKPTPTPAPPAKAWGKLGVATIARGGGVIAVGKDAGAVRSVMLQVEGSDAVLQDVVIEFGNGEKFSPPTKLVFAEGSRSRTIDLPGDARFIRKVSFRAQNLPGGGRASIVLFGR